MISLRAVVCIFFAIHFTSSHALQCYDCIFYEDYKSSDPSCQYNPDTTLLKTCYDLPSFIDGETPVCKKVTGFLNGKPAVIRECARSLSALDGLCSSDELRIGKSFTNDAYGCICTGERCNGATEIKFGCASLFAIIAVLHAFFKLISARDQYIM
ncbi:uncharacterized protein LOC119078957 [Bradysia coprophila]|uniref:uncharacterized protein LOC119078957 n=1 Tax=Bradysia coprophila TaxID=38358 RepID=UPI00187DD4E9|nr:uncharacterized protein LOC119078957 [Bradysia coprophila]